MILTEQEARNLTKEKKVEIEAIILLWDDIKKEFSNFKQQLKYNFEHEYDVVITTTKDETPKRVLTSIDQVLKTCDLEISKHQRYLVNESRINN